MAGEVAGIGALLRPNKYSILKFVEIHPGSSYVRISPLPATTQARTRAACWLTMRGAPHGASALPSRRRGCSGKRRNPRG